MTTGTRSDYATHIGKSQAYVTKLGHQGRLVEREDGGKRLIDFELTDRLIRNTTDLGRARNGVNAKPGSAPSLPVAPIAEAGRVDAIFRQAQAQERAYNAKIAELEYRRRAGELVRLDEVVLRIFGIARGLRDGMGNCSRRIAAEVAALADPVACEAIIAREHRQLLGAFTDALRQQLGAEPPSDAPTAQQAEPTP